MDKIKRIITKINDPLTSFNFINALGILFWLLIAISIVSVPIIYFSNKPAWLLSSQGFNNLLDIYKFPFYLLAGALAVITLRITLVRVNQTYEQIESSYRPILYLTYYLQLYILYCALVFKEILNPGSEEARDKYYELIDKFPRLKLKILYIDLGNKEESKEYIFQFRDLMYESALKSLKLSFEALNLDNNQNIFLSKIPF